MSFRNVHVRSNPSDLSPRFELQNPESQKPDCKFLVPPAPTTEPSLQGRLLRDHIANINGQMAGPGSHWTAKEMRLFQPSIMVKAEAACIHVEMEP